MKIQMTLGAARAIATAGLECCRKIIAQVESAREAIIAEATRALQAPEHVLRLAVNEAEAVAWQTQYPHLVFPSLAAEKVESVAYWNTRQETIRQTSPVYWYSVSCDRP